MHDGRSSKGTISQAVIEISPEVAILPVKPLSGLSQSSTTRVRKFAIIWHTLISRR